MRDSAAAGSEDQPKPDDITLRLEQLAVELESRYGHAVEVARSTLPYSIREWVATPSGPRALGVAWMDHASQLQLEALTGRGGRWELERTTDNVDFIHAVVAAIAAGDVK